MILYLSRARLHAIGGCAVLVDHQMSTEQCLAEFGKQFAAPIFKQNDEQYLVLGKSKLHCLAVLAIEENCGSFKMSLAKHFRQTSRPGSESAFLDLFAKLAASF